MAFWFVVPVVLVGAAGYTMLNQPAANDTKPQTKEDMGNLELKAEFSPPAIEVNSKLGKPIRSGGRLIGRRPKRKKPVEPVPEATSEPPVQAPPILEPPPTSSPVDGGG